MTCWHFHNLALGNPDHAYFAMAPFLLAASLLVPIVTKVDSSGFLCVAGLHLPSACPKSFSELGGWRCKCCRVGQCRGISPGHVEGSRNLIGFGWRSFGFLSLQVFGTYIFTWTPSLHVFSLFTGSKNMGISAWSPAVSIVTLWGCRGTW